MFDSNFNAKLGDFGLAKLVDHEKGAHTTTLAGTRGYMAPEYATSGRASKESDVYSFGVVALEICGRKPILHDVEEHQMQLVEWVWESYGNGTLLEVVDPLLGLDYEEEEIKRLMIVGLWCVYPDSGHRPSIRQVIQVLNSEASLPILPSKMPVATYLFSPMSLIYGDSSFFNNQSSSASKKDLWGACSRLGKLVDIYIAGRKDASGAFFAFIRYSDISDPGAVEDGLCNIICRGRKLVANCAKHPRNIPKLISKRQAIPVPKPFAPAPRDSRSFAEVAGRKAASVEEKKVQLECIKEVSEWTDKSVLVAEAKCYVTLCNFPSLVELEGYDVAEFKYLGGMLTMIKFKTDKAAEIFKANKCIWMKWFMLVCKIVIDK
ncbi:hypothetical protein LXL04_017116 [Taraxacum kok-saghyz]